MKRVVVTIVLLSASPLWALTFMGPPTSDLEKNQTRFGVDYTTGEVDVEIADTVTADDLDTDLLFARLGIALVDNTELFGRLGMADIGDAGNDLAWGAGFKATVTKTDPLSIGVLFQITHTQGDDSFFDEDGLNKVDIDIYEYQIAVGPSYRIDNLQIYGGPFFHILDGDLDVKWAMGSGSVAIEEDSAFGGYVGAAATIAENVGLAVEGQFTGGGQAFGVSADIRF